MIRTEPMISGWAQGFYVNATEAPFDKHYHMYDYITQRTARSGGGKLWLST
jgi:S-formylglutathione hydrolase FrmB